MTMATRQDQMETTNGRDGSAVNGKLVIKDNVVAKIAGMAAREIQGVSPASSGLLESVTDFTPGNSDSDVKRGIKAEVGEKQVAFDMWLVMDWGYNIPNVVGDVRKRIRQRVTEMTGLDTTEINIEITDVNLSDQGARVE